MAAEQLLDDTILFHAAALLGGGGSPGVIEDSVLVSAVHRPFAMYGGAWAYKTPLEQAAALMESLCTNHGFMDGNKRTGTTACLYFLERSGYWRGIALLTDKERSQLVELSVQVAERKCRYPQLVRELKRILGPTRNRRPRIARILSGMFGPVEQYLHLIRE
ncbi:MAG TPA: Fic family protein [Ktedonobacterales bacterium]|nr:Fic family protein [Ktedonobacterales bacterium]